MKAMRKGESWANNRLSFDYRLGLFFVRADTRAGRIERGGVERIQMAHCLRHHLNRKYNPTILAACTAA